ncbi:hypothetical protein NHX12_005711 [Muraenolepis orangiensis]|uniref:Uncharacterized protein n=1 Tax=Muraenolepis orangiensis TaxID=630683 RepID=A0A9Q0DRY0_9TELE|nr:hypothetical protein NHX12_005711 [Muraenolepis orangiensis]
MVFNAVLDRIGPYFVCRVVGLPGRPRSEPQAEGSRTLLKRDCYCLGIAKVLTVQVSCYHQQVSCCYLENFPALLSFAGLHSAGDSVGVQIHAKLSRVGVPSGTPCRGTPDVTGRDPLSSLSQVGSSSNAA